MLDLRPILWYKAKAGGHGSGRWGCQGEPSGSYPKRHPGVPVGLPLPLPGGDGRPVGTLGLTPGGEEMARCTMCFMDKAVETYYDPAGPLTEICRGCRAIVARTQGFLEMQRELRGDYQMQLPGGGEVEGPTPPSPPEPPERPYGGPPLPTPVRGKSGRKKRS